MQSKCTLAITDYLNGMPVKDVLQTYGVSKTQFYRVIKQLGITKRGPRDRFLPEEQQDIKNSYLAGETAQSIKQRYHSEHNTIITLLEQLGVQRRTLSEAMRDYTDEQIEATIHNYLNGLTAKAAGKLVGASEPTALRWLRDHSIPARHQADYGGNDNYFEVLDTDQKCYWFGFLAADGRAKKKYLEINLGMKDWNHLELFKSHVNYAKPVIEVERYHKKRQKWYKHAHFNWGSVKIIADLHKHGILQIKAGDLSPLIKLTDSQLRSFLRGYFDGDGSITFCKRLKSWCWYICGPHQKVIEYILSRCPEVTRFNAKWAGTAWRVAYMGNRLVPRICAWLYDEATVWLPRKLERAELCCGRNIVQD